MAKDNLKECLYKEAAVQQRIEELGRDIGAVPANNGFDHAGCYSCESPNPDCKNYAQACYHFPINYKPKEPKDQAAHQNPY